jgi:predicted hydrolase (HD superfamily)
VKPKSVRKKMKDKAFARAVNRQAIQDAANALGIELSAFITVVLTAMQEDHEALGL